MRAYALASMIAAGVREILVMTGIGEGVDMAGIETRISDSLLLRAFEEFRIAQVKSSLPLRRGLAGYALAAALALVLAVVLTILGGQLDMTIEALAVLVAVTAVALLGGLVPAVLEAIAGSLLTFSFTWPRHTSTIAGADIAAAVAVCVALAVVVGLLADNAVRHAGQAAAAIAESEAARPIADADRMRTALLAAVSHDLRTPVAAAKAAVSWCASLLACPGSWPTRRSWNGSSRT